MRGREEAREKNRLNVHGFICNEAHIDTSRLLYEFTTGENNLVTGMGLPTSITSPTATMSGAFEVKQY